jgi:hypothetical protein
VQILSTKSKGYKDIYIVSNRLDYASGKFNDFGSTYSWNGRLYVKIKQRSK